MSLFDHQYVNLVQRILAEGTEVSEDSSLTAEPESNSTIPVHMSQIKEGTKTVRLPHQVLKFDLQEEFPILTLKKTSFKSAVLEMLWIYQVQNMDIRWLQERGIHIWDKWEIDEEGNYNGKYIGKEYAHTPGKAYGWFIREYKLIDNLISTIKQVPHCRRMIMSFWQNDHLKDAALPSCVWNTQWNVLNGKLNVMVGSRSEDVPLGLPFDVLEHAVLCHLLAQVCDLEPGIMTFTINDAHIYMDQMDGILELLKRYDEGKIYDAPKLWVNPKIKDFYKFDNSKECKDIKLEGYEHAGSIKMNVTE